MSENRFPEVRRRLREKEEFYNNLYTQYEILSASVSMNDTQKLITDIMVLISAQFSYMCGFFGILLDINEITSKELSMRDETQTKIARKISEKLAEINDDFEKYKPILESGLSQLEKLNDEK